MEEQLTLLQMEVWFWSSKELHLRNLITNSIEYCTEATVLNQIFSCKVKRDGKGGISVLFRDRRI